jgi:tripartite-type tricarboxylate transporter receptor subunit TctC
MLIRRNGRRSCVAALIAPVAFLAWGGQSSAQSYPAKPIRIVVSLAAGGGVDTSARIVAQKLTEAWGQQIVVENRPGAGGTIATEMVARAVPDGYTLLMTSSAFAITPSLYKLAYDPVKDFTPVMQIVLSPHLLVVHPSVPVHSVRELIAFAKGHPNQLLWSSSGNGSPQHLAAELFKMMTGVKIVHVPYKGTAPSINDLIGGRVSLTAASVVSTMPQVKAGRLRAFAVLSSQRSLAVPQYPSVAEAGVPGYEVDVWYGLFAPAGTPKVVVTRLYEEIARTLAQPVLKERMYGLGLDPAGMQPDRFASYVQTEIAKWAKVVKAAGAKAE